VGKKYKNKKNSYKKYRKNPNRSVVDKFYCKLYLYNLINEEIDELVKEIDFRKTELDTGKKKNNKMILIFSIFLFFLSAFIVFIFSYPSIELVGDKEIILKYNSEYIEEGAKGVRLFNDISEDIEIHNNIDTSKVGEYLVTYSYNYFGFDIRTKRIVKVVDDESPVITLKGTNEVNVCPSKEYVEDGFTAIDEYDGDITDKVVIEINDDIIYYYVKDSSGNEIKASRKIYKLDKEKPQIELLGNKTVYLYRGNNYVEPGYKALDNCDGDITSKVEVNNKVNINKVGSYTIEYKVSDKSGNTTSINRTIIIREPIIYNNNGSNGVIYLTFDDGPSNGITPKILDILKEENVKATFFVISGCDNFNSLVKREYNEGHTVALHSYTHRYDLIYKSIDNYFNDLNKIRNQVYNATGEYSNIIRFPGGSSNSISKRYSSGIMSTLVNEVDFKGYHYFDWNISSGDAGGVSSSSEVYYNVVNSLNHNRSNVVLMHDFENNYYTLNALRDIIRYGKNNGYTFDKITMSTKEVHHNVIN